MAEVLSLFERRTGAEWELLQQLAAINPQRLSGLRSDHDTFFLKLHNTPGLLLDGTTVRAHDVRIAFPPHYPAVPMTLYLSKPVWHPNVHPATGFVCLWLQHRIADTVEHALHKTVAMLGLKLYNADAVHVMQPQALQQITASPAVFSRQLTAEPLLGVLRQADAVPPPSMARRVRLS